MQSEHAHLDMNVSQGYEPRVSSKNLLKKLTESALKNVPGSEKLIAEHFGTADIKGRLLPEKIQNQAMHLGWGHQ